VRREGYERGHHAALCQIIIRNFAKIRAYGNYRKDNRIIESIRDFAKLDGANQVDVCFKWEQYHGEVHHMAYSQAKAKVSSISSPEADGNEVLQSPLARDIR